jgi:hypothetical protein
LTGKERKEGLKKEAATYMNKNSSPKGSKNSSGLINQGKQKLCR